ncbi:hypothetical protein DAT35_43565 [Vitiosangium sp. GDMCC 1.1324]|nr:hypothetical protein DAT35_43565 [Vitiosangium sp. GDMCC 1.1324]
MLLRPSRTPLSWSRRREAPLHESRRNQEHHQEDLLRVPAQRDARLCAHGDRVHHAARAQGRAGDEDGHHPRGCPHGRAAAAAHPVRAARPPEGLRDE